MQIHSTDFNIKQLYFSLTQMKERGFRRVNEKTEELLSHFVSLFEESENQNGKSLEKHTITWIKNSSCLFLLDQNPTSLSDFAQNIKSQLPSITLEEKQKKRQSHDGQLKKLIQLNLTGKTLLSMLDSDSPEVIEATLRIIERQLSASLAKYASFTPGEFHAAFLEVALNLLHHYPKQREQIASCLTNETMSEEIQEIIDAIPRQSSDAVAPFLVLPPSLEKASVQPPNSTQLKNDTLIGIDEQSLVLLVEQLHENPILAIRNMTKKQIEWTLQGLVIDLNQSLCDTLIFELFRHIFIRESDFVLKTVLKKKKCRRLFQEFLNILSTLYKQKTEQFFPLNDKIKQHLLIRGYTQNEQKRCEERNLQYGQWMNRFLEEMALFQSTFVFPLFQELFPKSALQLMEYNNPITPSTSLETIAEEYSEEEREEFDLTMEETHSITPPSGESATHQQQKNGKKKRKPRLKNRSQNNESTLKKEKPTSFQPPFFPREQQQPSIPKGIKESEESGDWITVKKKTKGTRQQHPAPPKITPPIVSVKPPLPLEKKKGSSAMKNYLELCKTNQQHISFLSNVLINHYCFAFQPSRNELTQTLDQIANNAVKQYVACRQRGVSTEQKRMESCLQQAACEKQREQHHVLLQVPTRLVINLFSSHSFTLLKDYDYYLHPIDKKQHLFNELHSFTLLWIRDFMSHVQAPILLRESNMEKKLKPMKTAIENVLLSDPKNKKQLQWAKSLNLF